MLMVAMDVRMSAVGIMVVFRHGDVLFLSARQPSVTKRRDATLYATRPM
jgi:hypothetical protein